MAKPVKGILAKLRRSQAEPEPELELAPHRLAALRHRAAVAEDPDLADFGAGDGGYGDSDRQGRGLQPIVLVRQAREADTPWNDATSWFGGLPKLGAIAWPIGADGLPLPFVAQIGLADVAAARSDNPLPQSGSLAFFVGDGAVIHVPEGVTQFTPAPEDLPPAFDEGGHLFPAERTPLSNQIFPFWPVEPLPLTLPTELRDHRDDSLHPEIRAAMDEAVAAELPRRAIGFSATSLPEGAWGGPVPVWWYGVDHFIEQLRLALASGDGVAEGQRDGLAALVGALQGFAAERDPWTPLNADEHDVFAEAMANAWQQSPDLLRYPAPSSTDALATLTIRAMMTGDAEAFAALPGPALDLINREHRLPIGALPQMFGLGTEIQTTVAEHLEDVLLLQLPYDDMMEWRFGDNGLYQFWISPEALAEKRWDAVELNGASH